MKDKIEAELLTDEDKQVNKSVINWISRQEDGELKLKIVRDFVLVPDKWNLIESEQYAITATDLKQIAKLMNTTPQTIINQL